MPPSKNRAQCKHPQTLTTSTCDMEVETVCCYFKHGCGISLFTDYDESPNSWGPSAIDALHHGKSEECR